MSIESQDNHIKNLWRSPITCPSCKKKHTMMTLIGGEDKYDPIKPYPELFCPETKEQLYYKVGLFAPQQFLSLNP